MFCIFYFWKIKNTHKENVNKQTLRFPVIVIRNRAKIDGFESLMVDEYEGGGVLSKKGDALAINLR